MAKCLPTMNSHIPLRSRIMVPMIPTVKDINFWMKRSQISLPLWRRMGMQLSTILKLRSVTVENMNLMSVELHWNVFWLMSMGRFLILTWNMIKNSAIIRRRRLRNRSWIIWKIPDSMSVRIILRRWHIKSQWCAMQCLKTVIRNILPPRSQAMSLRSLLPT